MIRPEQAATPVARQRFLQEARAAAAVEHENIVTIYQVGEDNGTLYLAMQLLQGESLAERLRREGKMRLGDLIRIGRHVSLGLSAAHQHGLIHRDIKPANVFLERIPGKPLPRVKILDFGLARQAQSAATGMTQAGLVIGTPGYMAPEQARSLPLDHRCDLFSLGCILHHMASGQPPFKGDDALALLVAQTVDAVPPLSELRSDAPPELSNLVERLLAKSPDERPANADMVAEGLSMIAQKLTHDRLPAAGRTGGTRTASAASSPPARAESARPERAAPASRMAPKSTAATAAAEATDADVAEADWKSIDSLPAGKNGPRCENADQGRSTPPANAAALRAAPAASAKRPGDRSHHCLSKMRRQGPQFDRPKLVPPEEEGDGKDRDTADYLDADEALNGNAKDPAANDSNAIDLRGVDRSDEEPRPFSTSCVVIGYIASKTDDKGNPIIDQLVLGITGEDGQMHYAGRAPVPQTPDVLKQFQQLAGQLKLRAKPLIAVPGDLKNLIAVEASANCKVNYKEQDAQRLLKNPVLQEVSFGKPPASR